MKIQKFLDKIDEITENFEEKYNKLCNLNKKMETAKFETISLGLGNAIMFLELQIDCVIINLRNKADCWFDSFIENSHI